MRSIIRTAEPRLELSRPGRSGLRAVALAATLIMMITFSGCGQYSPITRPDDQTSTDDRNGGFGGTPPLDRLDDEDETAGPPVEPATPPAEEADSQAAPPTGNGHARGNSGANGSGSGSVDTIGGARSNDASGGARGGGTPTSPPPPPAPNPYPPFELPKSDTSVNGNNGPALAALNQSCEAARTYLNGVIHFDGGNWDQPLENVAGENPTSWGFLTPRYTVLYMSALLRVCGRDLALADALASGGLSKYGGAGIDRPDLQPVDPDTGEPYAQPGYGEPECDLYRTFLSMRDQIPMTAISCAEGGAPPDHVSDPSDTVWDDPCTFDEDESSLPWTGEGAPPRSLCAPVQDLGLLDRYVSPDAPSQAAEEVARPTEVEETIALQIEQVGTLAAESPTDEDSEAPPAVQPDLEPSPAAGADTTPVEDPTTSPPTAPQPAPAAAVVVDPASDPVVPSEVAETPSSDAALEESVATEPEG